MCVRSQGKLIVEVLKHGKRSKSSSDLLPRSEHFVEEPAKKVPSQIILRDQSPRAQKSELVYPDEPLQIVQEKVNTIIQKNNFSGDSNISEEISENKKYYEDNQMDIGILG